MAANKRHRTCKKRKRVNIEIYAERLRKRMTKAEVLLWRYLKTAMIKWDVVFESQGIVLGRYIADFVCHEKRLIVELDGSIHNLAHIRRKDKQRTEVLERFGYTVLRFDNKVVFTSCYQVLNTIRLVVK